MTAEGTKDRVGNNSELKWLKDRTWNYDTQRECQKTKLINDSGVASIKGTLVSTASAIDYGWKVTVADDPDCIGVVAEDGVADGEETFIITGGSALVLLEDATASTHGYWARTSITQAGRADITNAAPPGHGIGNADIHFHEIGHCTESQTAGTDVLAEIIMHFN